MSFTFGFYNSVEHDRLYDAIQVSKIFDGLILDGVYETIGDGFIAQASDVADIVTIGPGRAWFHHTWNENDGYLDVELEAPETVLDRIDAIVLDIDERLSKRTNAILVVKGTPSSSPVKPTLLNETDHHQYPLCYVTRKASTDVISQSQIENAVGTSACPFVTGVLEGMDIDLLLLQWRTAWSEFLAQCQTDIDEWEDGAKEEVAAFISEFKNQVTEFVSNFETGINDWTDTTKTELTNWTEEQKASFTKFYNDFKEGSIIYMTEYTEWVQSLKDILDEDALGHLLLEFQKFKDEATEELETMGNYLNQKANGFQNKVTTFPSDTEIVDTFPDDGSTITTLFQDDGSIKKTLASHEGVVGVEMVTTFPEDGSVVQTITGGDMNAYLESVKTYDPSVTPEPEPEPPTEEGNGDNTTA